MTGLMFLVGLNAIDAWLIGRELNLDQIALNPMAPPLSANMVARGVLALVLALLLLGIGKGRLMLWVNLGMVVLVGWHVTVLVLRPFNLVLVP